MKIFCCLNLPQNHFFVNREIVSIVSALFEKFFSEKVVSVVPIVNSGSNRSYFRLNGNSQRAIGVYNSNIPENKSFISFAQNFRAESLSVPTVLMQSEDGCAYITNDLGDTALLDYIDRIRSTSAFEDETLRVYQMVLDELLKFQFVGARCIDFSNCFADKHFNRQLITRDLNYCRYYFFKMLVPSCNDGRLETDFDNLCRFVEQTPSTFFMYRDFQARNILLVDGEPWFIDFQGGMQGPLQYDVASLLFQARAGLSVEMRNKLLQYYVEQLKTYNADAAKEFMKTFDTFVFIRILQTLGAYGLRGLIEKKAHFISSILPALSNAQELLRTLQSQIALPEIERCITASLESTIIKKMTEEKKMKVSVNSFSFKRGVPTDHTGNGGGFVFDCRALPNPGKLDIYKPLTGKDQPVIDYLNAEPDVHEFIADAIKMVEKSVTRYQQRGFSNLMVNFGCTGGRHRSVFCAEAIAKHLIANFDVQIELHHLEQEKS